MAGMGPISSAQMPEFNIMGLLLGGRSYASGWFENRDRMRMAEYAEAQARQQAGEFADKMVASPELAAANANPFDRKAQWGMWGAMQHGPEQARGLGTDLLRTNIASIYQRDNISFDDELARARIKLTADENLRVDQVQRDRDAAAQAALYERVFGPDQFNPSVTGGQADALRTAEAKKLGLEPPSAGYILRPTQDGQLAWQPAPGSEVFRKATAEMQVQQDMADDAAMLAGHFDGTKTLTKGEYQAYRQELKFAAKKAFETGSLDAGSLAELDATLPEYGFTGTDALGRASEQLRVFIRMRERARDEISRREIVPLSAVSRAERRTLPDDLAEQRDKRTKELADRQEDRNTRTAPIYKPGPQGALGMGTRAIAPPGSVWN